MKFNFYALPHCFKVITVLWAIAFINQVALGQVAPAKSWDKTFGGTEGDGLKVIIQTQDGGFLVGGTSNSGQSGDRSDPNRGFSSADYWIIKTDAAGNKQWDKAYGGNDIDALEDIKQTADGGYIIGGTIRSRHSGDISGYPVGYPDYWIVRIDAAGNKLWDRVITSYGENYFSSLVQTSDGGFLVAGYSDGNYGHRLGPKKGGTDFWLIKLGEDGRSLWEKSIGGSGNDILTAMVATRDGNFLLCGYSFSGISGDKSQANSGKVDYWIIKVDPAGNKLWDKTYGGTGEDWLYVACQTQDGGFILGGSADSGLFGDKSEAIRGGGDIWIVKTDAEGNKQWDKSYGGNAYDAIKGVLQLADGGYLFAGTSGSESSGDRSQPLVGKDDFWLFRTDPAGNLLWERTLGGSDMERLSALVRASDGGFVLGGTSYSDPSGHKTQASRGRQDIWIVKLDEEGTSTMSQPPVIATTPGETAFTEGFNVISTPIAIDGELTLHDIDNHTLFTATIKISGGHQPKEDVLDFGGSPDRTGNISAKYEAASGILSLISEGSTATLAQWQAALRSVVYNNTSDSPTPVPRTVSLSVNDGDAVSIPVIKTITVTAVNDTPTRLTLSKQTISENVIPGTAVGTFTPTDPDANEHFTFSLISGEGDEDNQAFQIEGNSLIINVSPDYETKNLYRIRAVVSDAGGLTLEQAFTLTILDVDEIPPAGSFKINSGAAYTNDPYVRLSIDKGDATAIRISRDGTTWGDWYKIYTSSTYYSLTPGDGPQTLYLQLRDETGNVSDVYTDQIILDQTKPLPVITTTFSSTTSAYPLQIAITFGETVKGFNEADIVINGGILEDFSGNGQNYSLVVMPTVRGPVTISIPAGIAVDEAVNLNRMAVPLTVVYEGILRPSLSTAPVSSIRTTSAVVGGNLIEDGGAPVLERGILFSTDLDILIPATKVISDSDTGSFSITLNHLSPGTTYYVEAYAINEAGTTYGEELTFTTPREPVLLQEISKGTGDRSPTNAASITFSVKFNKFITGLKASNFRLATTGVTGAAIQQITGSGNSYTVTVKTGSGSGTIRLIMDHDAGLNFGIENLPNTTGMEYIIDKEPPVVTGVTHNTPYSSDRLITFNEGTATLLSSNNPSETPFASGTTVSSHGNYLLKVTDMAGNVTSLNFYIDKVAPAVTGVTHNTSYNSDRLITFSDGTATLLSSNNSSETPFASGTTVSEQGDYLLKVTDMAGNLTSLNFTIDKVLPVVTLTSSTPHAAGSTIPIHIIFSEPVYGFTVEDINVTGASKGNFSGESGSYTIDLHPNKGGSIQVQIAAGVATDIAGNENTAATPLSLSIVTGVDDLAEQASLQVYPNPVQVNGQLYVNLKGGRGNTLLVKLYDSRGRLLFDRSTPLNRGGSTECSISLHGFAQGLYYLYLSDAKAGSIKKIVVQ